MDKMTHYRELVERHIRRIVDLINRQYKTDEGEGVAHSAFDEAGGDNQLLVKPSGVKDGDSAKRACSRARRFTCK